MRNEPLKLTVAACSALLLALNALPTAAQSFLIRGATVHTAAERGTIEKADVLVDNDRIDAVGHELEPSGTAEIIDGTGLHVTPGLFGGLATFGLEEVSLEAAAVDHRAVSGELPPPAVPVLRPEFDVTRAYNPWSAAIAVNRAAGVTFALLPATPSAGSSIIAGQGALATLDGRYDAMLPRSQTLFVYFGGGLAQLTGYSRAAQYMLFDQAVKEAQSSARASDADQRLLTPAGREALSSFLGGNRVVFAVDRAADIRQVILLTERLRLRSAISGGAEAWHLATALARANIPVILDPLADLPANFDQLGARLDNAAILNRAGVTILFSAAGGAPHNARKIRQLAGNAVANGLPWEAALKAITTWPAEVFGTGDRLGSIEPGKQADLVLWDGDPLEVTSSAQRVWIAGRAANLDTRQKQLRDRYLIRKETTTE